MLGAKILEMCETAEEEQQEKEKVREGKVIKKKQQKENFVRCKESCICKEKICNAAGLKECSVYGDVMKSEMFKSKVYGGRYQANDEVVLV